MQPHRTGLKAPSLPDDFQRFPVQCSPRRWRAWLRTQHPAIRSHAEADDHSPFLSCPTGSKRIFRGRLSAFALTIRECFYNRRSAIVYVGLNAAGRRCRARGGWLWLGWRANKCGVIQFHDPRRCFNGQREGHGRSGQRDGDELRRLRREGGDGKGRRLRRSRWRRVSKDWWCDEGSLQLHFYELCLHDRHGRRKWARTRVGQNETDGPDEQAAEPEHERDDRGEGAFPGRRFC